MGLVVLDFLSIIFAIIFAVGSLLDCCMVFTSLTASMLEAVMPVFAWGFVYNISHGVSSGLTMLFFSWRLLEKLNHLKIKYGMLEV